MRHRHNGIFIFLAASGALSVLSVHLMRQVIKPPDGFGWLLWPMVWLLLGVLVLYLL